MLKSMTGYTNLSDTISLGTVIISIKVINSNTQDFKLNIDPLLQPLLAQQILNELNTVIKRGALTCTISLIPSTTSLNNGTNTLNSPQITLDQSTHSLSHSTKAMKPNSAPLKSKQLEQLSPAATSDDIMAKSDKVMANSDEIITSAAALYQHLVPLTPDYLSLKMDVKSILQPFSPLIFPREQEEQPYSQEHNAPKLAHKHGAHELAHKHDGPARAREPGSKLLSQKHRVKPVAASKQIAPSAVGHKLDKTANVTTTTLLLTKQDQDKVRHLWQQSLRLLNQSRAKEGAHLGQVLQEKLSKLQNAVLQLNQVLPKQEQQELAERKQKITDIFANNAEYAHLLPNVAVGLSTNKVVAANVAPSLEHNQDTSLASHQTSHWESQQASSLDLSLTPSHNKELGISTNLSQDISSNSLSRIIALLQRPNLSERVELFSKLIMAMQQLLPTTDLQSKLLNLVHQNKYAPAPHSQHQHPLAHTLQHQQAHASKHKPAQIQLAEPRKIFLHHRESPETQYSQVSTLLNSIQQQLVSTCNSFNIRSNMEISNIVSEMNILLDQIKEQIQNIE